MKYDLNPLYNLYGARQGLTAGVSRDPMKVALRYVLIRVEVPTFRQRARIMRDRFAASLHAADVRAGLTAGTAYRLGGVPHCLLQPRHSATYERNVVIRRPSVADNATNCRF